MTQPVEGLPGNSSHAQLIQVAHRKNTHSAVIDSPPFNWVQVTDPDLNNMGRVNLRSLKANIDQPIVSLPNQDCHWHAVDIARRRRLGGVKITMGVNPNKTDLFSASRGRSDCADADAVVAAEKYWELIFGNTFLSNFENTPLIKSGRNFPEDSIYIKTNIFIKGYKDNIYKIKYYIYS